MKRFENRPFVVLGVNVDPTRELMRDTEKQEQLAFRSWWDGNTGRIARDWRVEGFPTLFVLDHRGQIRLEIPGKPRSFETLDKEIERLVRAAEKS